VKRLHALVGGEHDLAETARVLRAAVRALSPTAVGGFQITCSDECEHECSAAFERGFALELLPRLKFGERVPFRIANPGARYEWGSVRIAEDHFATPEARRGFLVLVVKINGHVAFTESGQHDYAFGRTDRYGDESIYCGAIAAALGDSELPWVEDLRADLRSEGKDRLATLRSAKLAEGSRHTLFGALVAARLQARKCVLDIQDHTPAAPTVYIVVHGVTLNKPGEDGEVIGGLYVLDHRGPKRHERYHGLGDDPATYVLTRSNGRLQVSDPGSARERPVRDHRTLASTRLRGLAAGARVLDHGARGLLQRAAGERPAEGVAGRTALKALLVILAATSPLAAALLLVAEGAAGIHDAHHLHRAVDPATQERLARQVVEAVQERVDRLPPEVAQRVIDALQREFADAAPR
jgi:hypothetical protein